MERPRLDIAFVSDIACRAGLEGRAPQLKRPLLRVSHGEGRNPGVKDVLVVNDSSANEGAQSPQVFERAPRRIALSPGS